jgi:hypothetical protein
MPRPTDASKHPALALKANDLRRRSAEALETIPTREIWQELSLTEQTFLSYYIISRDGIAASRSSGMKLADFEKKCKDDATFLAVVNEICDHPKALAQMVLEDYLPISLVKLGTLMNSENENTQLAAIKLLWGATGFTQPAAPTVAVQVNNTIKSFKDPQTDWASPKEMIDG